MKCIKCEKNNAIFEEGIGWDEFCKECDNAQRGALKIEEKPTNSQGFPMEMGECSECGRQSWHTRYIYKGWRSRCCNA